MKMRYKALVRLMMAPEVRKVDATSGTALRTVVLEMGARKPHQARTKVMSIFRCGLNVS